MINFFKSFNNDIKEIFINLIRNVRSNTNKSVKKTWEKT